MELEDLYLINKEEWLDVIKDKCKKRAKTHFRVGLISLILLMIMLAFVITVELSTIVLHHDFIERFVLLLTIIFIALLSGWWVLNSHSFLKTIDGIGTPEQLLNKFKKYVKDESVIWTIGQLIYGGWFACFVFFTSDLGIIGKVVVWILILAFATYDIYRLIRGKYFVTSSDDEDITRRLQELIGEE